MLSAANITESSVDLSWARVGDDGMTGTATSYALHYALRGLDGTCPISASSFGGTVATGLPSPGTPPGTDAMSVTGLARQSDYCFVLQVADEASNAAYSDPLNVSTPDLTAPAAPALSATVFGNTITVAWLAVGDDGSQGTATQLTLQYVQVPNGQACPASASAMTSPTVLTSPTGLPAPLSAGSSQSQALTLAEFSSYCFALDAQDDVGNHSGFSSVISAQTGSADVYAPGAVTDLSAQALSATSVTLRWSAPSDLKGDSSVGSAGTYDLRYATDSACPITAATFGSATALTGLPIPAAPTTAESYLASVPASAGKVCFALRSSDGVPNTSALSNVASPPGVASLALGTATDTTAQLTWTEVANDGTDATTGAAAKHDLRYRTGSACPITPANFDDAGSTPVDLSGATLGSAGSPSFATATGLLPGRSYCFGLRVGDGDVATNTSVSVSLAVATPDTTPPGQVTGIQLVTNGARQVELKWNASGDDGTSGAALSYQLKWATGAGCAASFNYASIPSFQTLDLPMSPPLPSPANGDKVDINFGVGPSTHYCLAVTAADDGAPPNRSVPSAVFEFDSAADPVPPGTLTLATPVAGETGSSSATLHWTAVADDGTDASTGKVTSYDVRYVARGTGATDCAGLGASSYTSATPVAVQPLPLAAVGATETVVVGVPDQGLCAAAEALDAAGNRSTASNWVFLRDSVAPATPSDLHTTSVAATSANLALTAVGDDATAGKATTYLLRYATATCPAQASAFDWANATPVTVSVAPGTAGSADAFAVNGLTSSTTYCFALRVADEVPNLSGPALVQLTTTSPPPTVSATSPADDATLVSTSANLALTFTQAMDQTTLTVQSSDGACSGTVQLAKDSAGTNCLGFGGATLAMSSGNTVATWSGPPLVAGTRYFVRVTTGAKSAAGVALAAAFAQAKGFATVPAAGTCAFGSDPTGPQIVIAQVYGGGGGSSPVPTYKSDYVVLHNRSDTPVDLSGWSIQYASATGTGGFSSVTALSGTIQAGSYFLVQEGSGSAGLTIPTPDVAGGSITMSATAGKIALVRGVTAMGNSFPCPSVGATINGGTVVDVVTYGTTCGGSTATLSSTTAAIRNVSGCVDTGSNSADFTVGTPTPLNASSAPATCSCGGTGTSNETNTGALGEMAYCILQSPTTASLSTGGTTTVYGRVYEAGHTGTSSPHDLKAELGYGLVTADPFTQWAFTSATFNASCNGCGSNNDEYMGTLTAPGTTGKYGYTMRFSVDGANWTYCDATGNGASLGTTSFTYDQLGVLTVQ